MTMFDPDMTMLDHLADAQLALSALVAAGEDENIGEAMRQLAACNKALSACAVMLVERGVHAGWTQAGMARALDVPPSALRGVRRELGR